MADDDAMTEQNKAKRQRETDIEGLGSQKKTTLANATPSHPRVNPTERKAQHAHADPRAHALTHTHTHAHSHAHALHVEGH